MPIQIADASEKTLRLYPSRFAGPLLLICRKCEKKLKKSSHVPKLRVKKSLKRLVREDSNSQPLHVLSTRCMKLCPKGGVVVCPPAQLTQPVPGLVILRAHRDITALYKQCQRPRAT